MEKQPDNEKKIEFLYNENDVIENVENPRLYSTFGKMMESQKPSHPIYSFGRAERKAYDKVYSNKQLIKTQFLCKSGPGPVYLPKTDILKVKNIQNRFPEAERFKKFDERYDYYDSYDSSFEPEQAKISILKNYGTTSFKTSKKVFLSVY